jgi:hypothetical protein
MSHVTGTHRRAGFNHSGQVEVFAQPMRQSGFSFVELGLKALI